MSAWCFSMDSLRVLGLLRSWLGYRLVFQQPFHSECARLQPASVLASIASIYALRVIRWPSAGLLLDCSKRCALRWVVEFLTCCWGGCCASGAMASGGLIIFLRLWVSTCSTTCCTAGGIIQRHISAWTYPPCRRWLTQVAVHLELSLALNAGLLLLADGLLSICSVINLFAHPVAVTFSCFAICYIFSSILTQ